MAVKKPNLLDGKAQSRVVRQIASESKNAVKKPELVGKNTNAESASVSTPLYDQRPTDNPWAQRAYDNQVKNAQLTAETPDTDPATAWERGRLTGVTRGAAASTAAGGVNFVGLLLDSARNLNTAAQEQNQKIKVAQENIARYTAMMNQPGADKAQLQRWIASNERTIKEAQSTLDTWNKPTDKAVSGLYGTADKLAKTSEKEIASAKEGLGTAGQLAVDVGVAGLQMAGDAVMGGLPAMFVRSTGGAAQEARQSGAALDQQLVYGLGSGALSAATEKIANVAGPFKKVFGEGLANKAAGKLIAKFGENQAVQVMTRLASTAGGKAVLSAISEGGEEVLEDLVQPYLKRATYDKNATFNAQEAGRDFLVGALLGGIGSAGEVASNIAARNTQRTQNTPAQGRPAQTEGNSMGAPENAVQGVSGGVMEQEAQRLFGNNNPPAQGTGYAATEMGRPDTPLGVSATQEDTTSVSPSAGNASKNMDPLLELLTGGKRVDQTKLTNEQFATLADRGDIGMDAGGKVYQVDPAQHIDQRGAAEVADRSVNAFQFDHPQLQTYYKGAAETLMTELMGAEKGGQTHSATGEYGQTYSWRNKRNASPRISYLLDEAGMQYNDIEKALDAIIHDKGQENYANAKRVEMVLDDMLTNGYNDGTQFVPANQQYIAAKDAIAGSQADSRGHGLDDIDADMGGGPAPTYTYADTQTATPTTLSETLWMQGYGTKDKPGWGEVYGTAQEAFNDALEIIDKELADKFSKAVDESAEGVNLQENFRLINTMVHAAELVRSYDVSPVAAATVVSNAYRNNALDSLRDRRSTLNENALNQMRAIDNSRTAGNDGLGNANAGTVNTDFDDMQAKSDSFHPVNKNSEQRIMNDQQRAPSEVPTVNPDTGKNIGKTVSTILNSPLTSPEMATQIESAVADGQFDYIPVTDRDANLKAQQDLSNRGLQTVADSFIAKVELGQRVTKNDTASAIAAYNQAVADGNHALAFDLMTAIADAAHDSAQVVQSMNLLNRLTPEGKLITLRRFVDKMNRQQSNKPGRRAANTNAMQEQVDAARTNYVEQATGFRISDELAANYLMAETDAERAAAWDAITTDIASQIPSTFREKANFWRYTSMLLNPTTHVRNFMGNAIQAGARTIKNGVGAVIERAAIKDASQRTKSVLTGKEGKALKDFAKAQYEADQSAAMGAGKYSDASTAGINREIQEKRKMFQDSNPLSKAVQAVGDFNTKLLDLGDLVFNKSAYVDSFAQALKAKGVTAEEAASGAKADLVAQARAYAIEEAQRATYRNTTALSEFLSKIGRYNENGSIVEKGASIFVDANFPFRRTPSNVLTTGIDYSPVGLAKAITYDAYQVKAGNMSAADMVDHLSAGLTGSGILALGMYLAAEGLLRVRTGDDDKEKAYNKDRGMQDYSLQIGDKSYTLDWAVPAAMPLFAGAAIMEAVQEGGNGFSAVADAMGGIGQVVLETSMLSSLNDFISNISYADDKFLYTIDSTISSYASQYVPTIGGKIASAMDDTARKSYVEKGAGQLASDANYFLQSMEKKIPGARQNLQPKIDLWGDEVSNGKVADRLLQSFLSPGYAKTMDTGKLDTEIRRLAEATGSSAVYPSEVEKSFKVGGETKNLTAEEYTKYAKTVGKTRKDVVSSLIGSAAYKKLSDEDRAKAVSYAYEYATVKGKQAVSSYKPSDSSFAKGAMNSVLPVESYILYKITADKDGNGRVSAIESANALQGMSGLTDKQRWQEWARLNDGQGKADKASAAGLTVGEYASIKGKADANGNGTVTKDEAMQALAGQKNRADLWDIICTTNAKNPYK